MKKTVLSILCANLVLILSSASASAADAREAVNMPFTLVSLLAIALLLLSCKLYSNNIGLKKELARYRARLLEYTQRYEPIKVGGPASKATGEADKIVEPEEEHAKKIYWDRISSTIGKTQPNSRELEELQNKKKDLEGMIELTKRKYHQRELDEKSFSDIIKDQQKQIIEIEARINKLVKGG
ncbi:MAG: hypothetical protein FJY77_04255 [Candidatus Altiarchaeales archaeon]|nr:hypothetical protein [Candidatus Altiarchaeales archaeon]